MLCGVFGCGVVEGPDEGEFGVEGLDDGAVEGPDDGSSDYGVFGGPDAGEFGVEGLDDGVEGEPNDGVLDYGVVEEVQLMKDLLWLGKCLSFLLG